METNYQEKISKAGWKLHLEKFLETIPKSGRFFIIVCLIAGVIFRIVNIDGKIYWGDENYTSLRVSGYTEEEVVRDLSNSEAITIGDLKKYQYPINPSKTVADTVKGLAKEEPQLTPIYFVAVRFWVQLFGNSVTAVRSFSVLASILALVSMGWLCRELFGSTAVAWVGVSLLAVSPFHLLYAQEARPFAWWTVGILASSAALLRAMRRQTRGSWVIYALTLLASLYTYLFSVLVLIAHALYVVISEKFRPSRKLLAFIACAIFVIALFSPWLLVIVQNVSQINRATPWEGSTHYGLKEIYGIWAHHLVLAFVDPYAFTNVLRLPASKIYSIPITLLLWSVRLLIVAGFYVLVRYGTKREWLFILCLTLMPALALTVPDLLLGGTRSSNPRYLFPTYIGFQLAVTYLLGRLLFVSPPIAQWRQKFWRVAAVGLLSVGFGCCILIAQADLWWTKVIICRTVQDFAAAFNKVENASIVTDADAIELINASYYLDPKVPLMARPQCRLCHNNQEYRDTPYLPNVPATFSNIFLFKVSATEQWQQNLKDNPPAYPYTIPNQFCPRDWSQ